MHVSSRAAVAAAVALAAFTVAANAQYEPPAGYYDSAAGLTGTALRGQLRTIMSTGHVQTAYGDARYILDDSDQNPADPATLLGVYGRQVLTEPFDNAATWNREHVWPSSRGLGNGSNSTQGAYGDVHLLRPSAVNQNGDRGNLSFGGLGAAYTGPAGGGVVNRNGLSYWYAGTADEGDVARIAAYTATRWTTQNGNLNLVNGQGVPGDGTLGDLATLTRWNYRDTPDAFERRRNDVIYWGDRKYDVDDIAFNGTNNRNAFVDRPELFWATFQNNVNDAQLRVGNAPAAADGSSRVDLDLGRVIVGAAAPASQSVTLSKSGLDGTYYNVTASGDATSSVTGRYNAFENFTAAEAAAGTNPAVSRTLQVGLNAGTSAAGRRTGQVVIDNLDVTDGRGTGFGSLDGDDAINLSLSVLDHSNASFAATGDLDALSLDFGTVDLGDGAVQSASLFNLVSLADFTAGLDLDAILGTGDTGAFTLSLDLFQSLTAGGSVDFDAMFNAAATGTFSATYLLSVADEALPGATRGPSLSLSLRGTVVPEPAAGAVLLLGVASLLAARRRGNG